MGRRWHKLRDRKPRGSPENIARILEFYRAHAVKFKGGQVYVLRESRKRV